MRALEPLKHLPQTLARALPVTDITALHLPADSSAPALSQADCDRLQTAVAAELQSAVQEIVQQQVRGWGVGALVKGSACLSLQGRHGGHRAHVQICI